MNDTFTNEDFASLANEMEKEAAAGTFQSPYWKPANEGTHQIRIITPLKRFGEKLFYEKHKMHYINGRAYFCLNQTLKDKNGNIHEAEACPICAKSKALYNSSTKGTEEWGVAGSLRAKDRYVSRVIVRGKKDKDGTDTETKPEFWEFGTKIHGYFFDQIKMGEAGNFLSLKEGRDFNLIKKGTGRNTDYSGSCLSMKQSAIFSDPEKLKQLLVYLPEMDYSKLVEFVSPDEMKTALDEMFNSAKEATPIVDTTVDSLDPYSQPAESVAPASQEEQPVDNIDDLLSKI
jgi:hypothetical protein